MFILGIINIGLLPWYAPKLKYTENILKLKFRSRGAGPYPLLDLKGGETTSKLKIICIRGSDPARDPENTPTIVESRRTGRLHQLKNAYYFKFVEGFHPPWDLTVSMGTGNVYIGIVNTGLCFHGMLRNWNILKIYWNWNFGVEALVHTHCWISKAVKPQVNLKLYAFGGATRPGIQKILPP